MVVVVVVKIAKFSKFDVMIGSGRKRRKDW
jgi:hypothetical protein